MNSRCSRTLSLVWPSKTCIKKMSLTDSRNLILSKLSFQQMSGIYLSKRSRMCYCETILKEALSPCSQVAACCKCSQPLPPFRLGSDHITQAPKLSVGHSTAGFSTFVLGWLWPAGRSPPSHSLTISKMGEDQKGKSKKNWCVEIKGKAAHARKT